MCEPQQDVHDGTLGVDDESHDGGEQVRDGALPVQDDGDALELDDDGDVQEPVHGGEVQVPDHDDALQVLELDDGLVYDAQDVVRALLLQVLLDDVRHREQVLPQYVVNAVGKQGSVTVRAPECSTHTGNDTSDNSAKGLHYKKFTGGYRHRS